VRAFLLVAVLGCAADETPTTPPPPAGCGPGTLPREQGCVPAGIETCADGFESDGNGGCVAVLPDSCAPALMAVPGETACRPVMPCGQGDWGDIAVDASTVFVKADYGGGSSDGTMARPFTTIHAAVAAAAPGAIVAVAAGDYAGALDIQDKSVVLWGRCPDLARVTASAPSTIRVLAGADGTVLRGLGVSGSARGITLSGSRDVVLDRLWIHDTGDHGVIALADLGPTSTLLTGVLVEATAQRGVVVDGTDATIEASVVRGIDGAGSSAAIQVQQTPGTGSAGNLTLRGSVVEDNADLAVLAIGARLAVERTVIRRTSPAAGGGSGFGILADTALTGVRPNVTMVDGIVERSRGNGVIGIGADVTLERLVVRDTEVQEDIQQGGIGVRLDADPSVGPALLLARSSVIERSHQVGIGLRSSNGTLDSTIVRDVAADALGQNGIGIYVERGELVLRGSEVVRTLELGVASVFSSATLENVRVADVAPSTTGTLGDGVSVVSAETPAFLAMDGSRVEGGARAGVSAFGAIVELAGSMLTCNLIDLAAEPWNGHEAGFIDAGGNTCGCGDMTPCKAVSSGLTPPSPLGE
jgi:hypothetical protein